jgi:hypothetical protein
MATKKDEKLSVRVEELQFNVHELKVANATKNAMQANDDDIVHLENALKLDRKLSFFDEESNLASDGIIEVVSASTTFVQHDLDFSTDSTKSDYNESSNDESEQRDIDDTLVNNFDYNRFEGKIGREPKRLTFEYSKEEESQTDVAQLTIGPSNSFYIRWADHSASWELLTQNLSLKLRNRNKNLPKTFSLSIDVDGKWLIIFADGSFASSPFTMPAQMKKAFLSDNAEPELFLFAPAGGWILLYNDGSIAWERLPTGLDELLRRRTKSDSKIVQISISAFGGWFLSFADGECEWEGLPASLQSILIANVRKLDPKSNRKIIVSLSLYDGFSYFVYIPLEEHAIAEWVGISENLNLALQYPQNPSNLNLPLSVEYIPAQIN